MPRHTTSGQRVWWVVVTVLGSAGIVVAPVLHPPGTMLPGAVAVGVVVAVVTGGMSAESGDSLLRTVAYAARSGLLSGLAVLAMITYISLFGAAACLLFLALAGCSPPVIHQFTRWRARQATASQRQADVQESIQDGRAHPLPAKQDDAIATMSTLQIAIAWRRSFWDLKKATNCRVRAEIVNRRQAYLDELEGRDPEGLRCWLDAGPRAADNPTKFFRPQDPPSAVAS
jgi:type III secretory pathway component EscV